MADPKPEPTPVRFVSKQYPQLAVFDLDVQFVDGEAVVTDPEKAAVLDGMADLGVSRSQTEEV